MCAQSLSLRHPGQPHAFNEADARGAVRRIVAVRKGNITVAADSETWIERKPRIHGSPRFVQPSEPREHSREIEKCDGVISVCVEAPAHPDDSFGIGTELRPRKTDVYEPSRSQSIAGG